MIDRKVKESSLVPPFFIFFLIHSSQTGIGILGYQRKLIEGAGQDAWQSIIITGLSIHLIIYMMFSILKNSDEGDLISINKGLFGKVLGHTLSFLFLGYLVLSSITVVRSYIEVLQVWVFPKIHTWELTLLMLIVIYYIVAGGFRVVTGISFFGVILPSILILTIVFPLKYAHWNNLLPLFNHSLPDLLESAKSSTIIYIGFESLFLYFPFVKSIEKSAKWAHLAVFYTMILYLLITIVSLVYFSQGQLQHTVWATLILSKIIHMPFIERFEYIFIFTWFLVILPPICVAIWGVTRGGRKILNIKPKASLIAIIILMFLISLIINNRIEVAALEYITSNIGFYVIYAYVPLMYILTKIRVTLKRNKFSE